MITNDATGVEYTGDGSPAAVDNQQTTQLFFIDFSAGAGGDGSRGLPYNDFTQFNALTGDQNGATWKMLRGQSTTDTILNQSAFNYKIDAYGDIGQPKPIIDATGKATSVRVSGNNISLWNFNPINAQDSTVFVSNATPTCHMLHIKGVPASNIFGNSPENGFNIKPSVLSLGCIIEDCDVDQAGGNAYEFSYLDGAIFRNNTASNLSNVYEAWQTSHRCLFEKTRADNCDRLLWLANEGGAGSHSYIDNVMKNCAGFNMLRGLSIQQNTTGSISVTGMQFFNNTVVASKYNVALEIPHGSGYTIVNNILYMSFNGATGVGNSIYIEQDAMVGSLIDNNYYFQEESGIWANKYSLPKMLDGATIYQFGGNTSTTNNVHHVSALNQWADNNPIDQATWGGTIAGDPFVDVTTGDLNLKADSEALWDAAKTQVSVLPATVRSNMTTEDINGNPRVTDNDCGAYQYIRP